jgi:hypothetical protein
VRVWVWESGVGRRVWALTCINFNLSISARQDYKVGTQWIYDLLTIEMFHFIVVGRTTNEKHCSAS